MRCPHCAAQAPEGSRFCGICGRKIADQPVPDAGAVPAAVAAQAPAMGSGPGGGPAASLPVTLPGMEQPSMSLFELPVSRGARWARILAILALDAVLAGAGIAMIVSYLHAREGAHSAPPPGKDAGLAEVEVLAPVRPQSNTAADNDPPAQEPAAAPAGPAPDPATPLRRDARPRKAAATPASHQDADGRGSRAGTTQAGTVDMAAPAALAPGFAAEPASEADIQRLSREVGLIVNRNTAQLQRCYHQAAKSTTPQDPIEGRLEIHIEIAASGRATKVYPIKNTSGSDPLARCVTALFESWTYPQPPGNDAIELVWPLHFKAPK